MTAFKNLQEKLRQVQPSLDVATRALGQLHVADIRELQAFRRPHTRILPVIKATVILLDINVPNLRRNDDDLWNAFRTEKSLLVKLRDFDKDNIPQRSLRRISTLTSAATFSPENIKTVSCAATGLCSWVLGIQAYAEAANPLMSLQKLVSAFALDVSCLKTLVRCLSQFSW